MHVRSTELGEFDEAVRSVARALNIIEALSRDEEMGITDLSRELGLNKATIYRLITTLRLQGYVEQAKGDKYKLTFKLFELGSKIVNRLGIRKIAYPYLEELAAITKETVNLGALQENNVCYIDRIESREPLRLGLDIGSRFPAHCTALGRVVLAHLDPAEMNNYLLKAERDGQIQDYTSDSLTDIELIKKELLIVRKQGYAIESEQYFPGIRCVACPIFNHTGKVVAAVSVAGPTVRVTDEFVREVIPLLKKSAGNISVRLGYKY
jgi:DNA-binding IclR family transcriptional regulator